MKKHYFLVPYLFFALLVMHACNPSKNIIDQLQNLNQEPEEIIITNTFPVNNVDGHIQGVQIFKHKKNDYYFFTGSSDNQSYYAIANSKEKEILSINELLNGDFRHAGGFQIYKNLLAVGIEDNIKKDRSKVQVFKIIDPEKPVLKLLKTIERIGAEKRFTAGCVAITEQKKNTLIAVGNWDTKNIDFYSMPTKKLKKTDSQFTLIHSLEAAKLDSTKWVEKSWYSYQNINFIWDDKKNLFLIGTAQDGASEMEIVDLFKVITTDWKKFDLQKVGHRKFKKRDRTTLKWGGGIFYDKQLGLSIFSSGANIRDSLEMGVYVD